MLQWFIHLSIGQSASATTAFLAKAQRTKSPSMGPVNTLQEMLGKDAQAHVSQPEKNLRKTPETSPRFGRKGVAGGWITTE